MLMKPEAETASNHLLHLSWGQPRRCWTRSARISEWPATTVNRRVGRRRRIDVTADTMESSDSFA